MHTENLPLDEEEERSARPVFKPHPLLRVCLERLREVIAYDRKEIEAQRAQAKINREFKS